jgi:hypothetical protein
MIVKKKEEPQRIGTIVNDLLSQRGYLSVCKEYGIMRNWESIAPRDFALKSTCDRIDNGVLYVKVSSAPWRQEAVYLKDTILRRIQKDEGCTTIKDIVFY